MIYDIKPMHIKYSDYVSFYNEKYWMLILLNESFCNIKLIKVRFYGISCEKFNSF